MAKKIIQNKIFIFFLYLLLAIILTWPLFLNLNRAYLYFDENDAEFYIWDIWQFKYTIFNLKQNPLGHLNIIFYPTGVNSAAIGYENLINKIPALILWPIFKNPLIIYNLLIILNFAWAAWTTLLLVFYLTKNKGVAFLVGIIFGFSSYMLARSFGHLNLLTTGYIPLFVLSFLKFWQNQKIKNAVLSALSFLAVSLSAWYYSLFLGSFVFFFLLYYFLISRKKTLNFIFSKSFFVFIFLSFLLTGLFSWPFLNSIIKKEVTAPAPYQTIYFSALVLNYFIPPPLTLTGKWVSLKDYSELSGNYLESVCFLGFLEIIILLYFLKNYHCKKFTEAGLWLFLSLVFFIFSLGPFLKPSKIILPYFLFYRLPVFSFARATSRYSLLVILSLAIICGFALNNFYKKIESKKKKNLIFGSLILLLVFERAVFPMPLKRIEIPTFYTEILKEKDNYAILDVPFFPIPKNEIFNFYQTVHQKKIVFAGLTSVAMRNKKIYQFINKDSFLNSLLCPKKTTYPNKLPSVNQVFKKLEKEKIKYLVVHKELLKNCPSVNNWLPDYLKTINPYFQDEKIIVYATF